jgi:hypothetical protein
LSTVLRSDFAINFGLHEKLKEAQNIALTKAEHVSYNSKSDMDVVYYPRKDAPPWEKVKRP